MTIWIFGDSFSTNYKIPLEQSWPEIISKKLDREVKNFAHKAVDNFFIFHNYINQKSQIQNDDVVLLQWTIPSRKMFIFDKNCRSHQVAIQSDNISVTRNNLTYFRSAPKNPKRWLPSFTNEDHGIEFFDNWYKNYFNLKECEVNLQAYKDACKSNNIIQLSFNRILNFITKNKLYLSEDDLHPNAEGHKRLANNIMEKINGFL
jgi:lysophospholipase L1-like esterase